MLLGRRMKSFRKVGVCAFGTAYGTPMRAVQVQKFGGVDQLLVNNIEKPVPNENQYLVKIHAAGVNPVETYIRAGQYAALPLLPWTPGKDAAGVIEQIGGDEKCSSHSCADHEINNDLELGTRIWTPAALGASAEYALVNKSDAFVLPDHLSFYQGAAIGIPYRTAYKALILAGKAKAGQSLLVHGASGAVGLACVHFAKAIGMFPIIGTASSKGGKQVLAHNGVDYILDHSEEGHMLRLNDIPELKNRPVKNKGVDLIIENSATNNLGEDLRHLQKGGTIVVVGSRGMNEVSVCPRDLMQSGGYITGVLGIDADEIEQVTRGVQAGVQSGVVQPVVQMPAYKLSELSEAHVEFCTFAHVEVIEHKRFTQGKIVVDTQQ